MTALRLGTHEKVAGVLAGAGWQTGGWVAVKTEVAEHGVENVLKAMHKRKQVRMVRCKATRQRLWRMDVAPAYGGTA